MERLIGPTQINDNGLNPATNNENGKWREMNNIKETESTRFGHSWDREMREEEELRMSSGMFGLFDQ